MGKSSKSSKSSEYSPSLSNRSSPSLLSYGTALIWPGQRLAKKI